MVETQVLSDNRKQSSDAGSLDDFHALLTDVLSAVEELRGLDNSFRRHGAAAVRVVGDGGEACGLFRQAMKSLDALLENVVAAAYSAIARSREVAPAGLLDEKFATIEGGAA